jgi:small-conductance mechanosensitive channel
MAETMNEAPSKLLRTLDRTVVNIPNAVFAAGEIENISVRDNIRYYPIAYR